MAQTPDFKNLSVEELLEMQQKLKGFIDRRMDAHKNEAINTIKTLVQQHELSFDEVVQAIRTVSRRGKAPAVYRNPENPRQTWSGQGKAPDWFTKNPDPESLRIPGA